MALVSPTSAHHYTPAGTPHDRPSTEDEDDRSIILGLIDEFVHADNDEAEPQQPDDDMCARTFEVMDSIVYVDETFDEDFDNPLDCISELQALGESEFGASSEELSPRSLGRQVEDARVTPSPLSLPPAPDETGAPEQYDTRPQRTSAAVETLYYLPETAREQLELELASVGVLIDEREEHRRILLIEQVEVTADQDNSDSDDEAVVLSAVPAANLTAHTRAQVCTLSRMRAHAALRLKYRARS